VELTSRCARPFKGLDTERRWVIKKILSKLTLFFVVILVVGITGVLAGEKQPIKAIYIPLADHYAGIVVYEKHHDEMKKADYRIERMKSWPLLRAYFMSDENVL